MKFQFALPLLLCCVNLAPCPADWPLYRGDAAAVAAPPQAVSLPATLKTLWEHRLERGWFQAAAIVAGETVFVGSSDLGMTAFRLDDGKERWRYPVEYGVTAPAAYFRDARGDESVFFGDSDAFLYALDARNGSLRWKFQAKGSFDNAPNVDRETGRVLVGSQDGTLYALNIETGKPDWTFKIDDQIRCFPSIVGRRCFVAGCDGRLHVVDLDRGTAVARVELGAPTGSTPAVLDDRAFFGTEGNEFLAVDWKKAEIVWRFKASQSFRGPAACKDGLVVFGGFDRTVRALDAETGRERWNFRTKGRMESSGPVIVGDAVYVPSSDSFLYVLDLNTGRRRSAAALPGKLLASPAVVDRRLVIGTDDGVLCCLGE